MTSWVEIDLAGISDEMETIPDGMYVFSLLAGAKPSKWDANKLEIPAKVAEGDFTNRVVYLSYPDPGKQAWSPAALKRLEKAVVADGAPSIEEGQKVLDYFNQPEVVGHKFIAPIETRNFEGQDGEQKSKTDIKLFKVRALKAA